MDLSTFGTRKKEVKLPIAKRPFQTVLGMAIDTVQKYTGKAHLEELCEVLDTHSVADTTIFEFTADTGHRVYGQPYIGGTTVFLNGVSTERTLIVVAQVGPISIVGMEMGQILRGVLWNLSLNPSSVTTNELRVFFHEDYEILDTWYEGCDDVTSFYEKCVRTVFDENDLYINTEIRPSKRIKVPITQGISLDVDPGYFGEGAISMLHDNLREMLQRAEAELNARSKETQEENK